MHVMIAGSSVREQSTAFAFPLKFSIARDVLNLLLIIIVHLPFTSLLQCKAKHLVTGAYTVHTAILIPLS